MKIVIIGGGWSGVAAAISAKKAGAEVHIYEKTDLLLGLGNVGGIMRNNGRYTASEELNVLGGGELIKITDRVATHRDITFPGHKNVTLYNVNKIEGEVKDFVESIGINLHMECRARDVEFDGHKIKGIYLSDDTYIEGDVFIETTGTTGPMGNCLRYGNGCSMCILRCPSFGPRISISERCGVSDIQGERAEDVLGAMSGSCKLAKESLSDEVKNELEEKGVVVLKVPQEDVNYDKLSSKVCQQYALKEFAENIILLDTGHAKLMTTYYPLQKLRKIKGLEHAKYVDPYAGSKGNSIRYLSVAPRTNDMKVVGVDNLFCAGEKSGLFVGHTEAICTGTLSGHNAVRFCMGMPLLILPSSMVIGDIIAYESEKSKTKEGRQDRYTFAGAGYFKRMQELGLYTMDIDEIRKRVSKLNLEGIFDQKLC
jgi:hypothetical protein